MLMNTEDYKLLTAESYLAALNLSKAFFDRGDKDSANNCFYKGLSLASSPTDFLFIASEIIDLKDQWWQEKLSYVFRVLESSRLDGSDLMIMANMTINNSILGGVTKAKTFYEKAIELADSSETLVHIAEAIAEKEKLFNKTWAYSVYEKSVAIASNPEELLYIANSILSPVLLNDKDFAIKVVNKAEKCAQNTYELSQIAEFIVSSKSLNDKVWGNKLLKRIENESTSLFELKASAEAMLEENPSVKAFEQARNFYKKAVNYAKDAMALRYLADSIADPNFLNDKDFAKEVYSLAIKMADTQNKFASSGSDLRFIAECVCSPKLLNDKEWARAILVRSVEAVKARNESYSTLADIAETILDLFNDLEWAKALYAESAILNREMYINVSSFYKNKSSQKKVRKNCASSLIDIAFSIADNDFLSNQNWAVELLDEGLKYVEEADLKERLLQARRKLKI